MKRICCRILVLCVLLGRFGSDAISSDFDANVFPTLKEHCFGCHGATEQKGDVRLDTLGSDLLGDSGVAETWHDVLGAISLGEMPPDDAPQLDDAERRSLTDWISGELERVVQAKRNTDGRPVIRRLNRAEYQNTMRDLLGIDTNFVENLPPEPLSPDGFKNNGASLQMSALQLELYLQTARSALRKVIVDGAAPPVFRHVLEEGNENGGRPDQAYDRSNVLGRTSIFLARVPDGEYPEQGEFLIRVRARAELAETGEFPRMEVVLGYRADTQFPQRRVGAIDVSSGRTRAYEFRARIEDFPLPSGVQSKFPGLLIRIANLYTDGTPLPEKIKVENPNATKKKRKIKTVWPEEPRIPKLDIESVEFVGPVYESWPPRHHTDILFPSKQREVDETGYAAEVLSRFMLRAYRRPVSAIETAPFVSFFERVRGTTGTFEEAIRETLAMVLISPDFLYLVEPGSDQKRKLDHWEIASRLSYFLWSTMPDESLFAAAEKGKLDKPAVLKRSASRMLNDERCWQFIDHFVDQWLDVGAVDRVAVNPEFYPNWDDHLKPAIRNETKHFFAEVLHHRLSAINFLESDFAMLNAPLARHYGIPGPRGNDFERISLPVDSIRGGLLAQASMLLGNSTGEDSHPVKRAVWIRQRLLDDPPADPPPNVPSLENTDPDFAKLPVRRQLEIHRQEASCNDCHRGIDPWGIALEQFGADGLHRESIARRNPQKSKQMLQQKVESETRLPDGTQISGLNDLKTYLAETQRERFARALVSKLLTYAVGRTLELTDQSTIDELTADFIEHDFQLHHLIRQLVISEPFLTK